MEKILIVGGTNFIGRNLIERLLELNQYEITIFNRGITNPDLFPGVNKIIGDRNTPNISLIGNIEWSYIIDLSCFFPQSVKNTLATINPNVKRYIFISTCSVYNNGVNKSILRGEDAITHDCTQAESIDTSPATYGKRKAACERQLQNSRIPYFILRPSLVYGKYDNTDRFYYWLYQTKMQNELLIPNSGEQIFSVTYVNDLVNCMVHLIKKEGDSKIYNVTSSPTLSISMIIDAASDILNKNPQRNYGNAAFLHYEQIKEWVDLPLWLDCNYHTYSNAQLLKDIDAKFTDFDVAIQATINYFEQLNWPVPTFGLTEKRKIELINKLK